MLLFRTSASVLVGQVHRYVITYVPKLDNVLPRPTSLFLRVKNTELFPLRAAYLNGPFIIYVDVKSDKFDPNKPVTSHFHEPAFESQVKAGQSFQTELRLDPNEEAYTWTVDVVSQIIFSTSASVGFELSLSRNEGGLHMSSHNGIYSDSVSVKHSDTAALWTTPPPDPNKPVHLVVIQHGLHSNTGADMLFLKEQIDKAAKESGENLLVRGYFDNACRTERGVKFLGKRLAIYVATCLRDDSIRKISFIGHSLGGLIMTYAIAYIHVHYPDFFEKIEPINFIALASPFLGLSNENPLYVKFALDFGLIGKTGQDLGLTWKPSSPFNSKITSKPLLRILPTGPAHEILCRFKRRTVYANIVNDGIVPLRTSSLLFLDWKGLSKAQNIRNDQKHGRSTSTTANTSDQSKPQVDNGTTGASVSKSQLVGSDISEIVPDANIQQKHNQNSNIVLRPLQYAFTYLRPQARKPSKIYHRSQTLPNGSAISASRQDAEEDPRPPPKTSVLEAASSILNPPLPDTNFILDPSRRKDTIIHDRIYRPEEIPRLRLKKHGTSTSSVVSTNSIDTSNEKEQGKVEEKIAHAWHSNMAWRKVLVRLEPDAHNNIVVRRTFSNAYGWPVIEHLIEKHFRRPY
ncbi:putative serine esterase-domain-containing protein, partial [Dipodascopsis tothii]|uniref:putative serine esterase-domain-containing protein n=1 Tax=Dipodascopsis tothii TaxID=44089 RepID=UPI0034CD198D